MDHFIQNLENIVLFNFTDEKERIKRIRGLHKEVGINQILDQEKLDDFVKYRINKKPIKSKEDSPLYAKEFDEVIR